MPNESKRHELERDRRRVPARSAAGHLGAIAAAIAAATIALTFTSTSILAREPVAGRFDYYALALSWSPTYCIVTGNGRRDPQCAPGRAYAFVVHGLWPQYERGWPEHCRTVETWVPEHLIESLRDIMPSKRLVIHEWKKHGSCSGLPMEEYFDSIRMLFAKVRIPARYLAPTADVMTTPEQLVGDFVKTNAALTSDMLSVQCGNARDRARLSELRVCFAKDGALQACGANERRRCRAKTLVLPRVR
jgi:ribonuclease T2